jgi:hypothetical protein
VALNTIDLTLTLFNIFKFELNPLVNKKDIGLYVLFRTFSGHFMTIFRSNYSSSSNQSNRSYDISWTGSPRKISRRALTPLLQENAKIVEVDEHNLFGA